MFAWLCLIVGATAAGRSLTAGQVMTGEPLDVPVNGSRVLTAARFAVAEFNEANAAEQFAYKVVKITSAQVQVVAGINFILDVRLGRTVCKKSERAVSETCALHPEPKERQCHFIVTEIPWENSTILTKNECYPNKV